QARGALTQAIRSADALVLLVDASAPKEVVDETFRDFDRFLDALEEGRTFGREVGGLPVFATLTKCDALRHEGDSPPQWLARIEQRKTGVRERFEDFFGSADDPEPSPYLPFGSIDLHLEATSVRAPKDRAFAPHNDPDGSFGVAGLVREVLPAAR